MLMTGYNLVRGSALDDFRGTFAHRFDLPEPETFSAIAFLRHVQRRKPFLHKVVQVTGFPDLWSVCPDAEGLGRMLFWLFFKRMNWMQNQNPYIYFVLPDQITLNDATHLYLRLSRENYADMTAVFGHMRRISSDHYHHNFTVSQV
jgi:hypothetical protein